MKKFHSFHPHSKKRLTNDDTRIWQKVTDTVRPLILNPRPTLAPNQLSGRQAHIHIPPTPDPVFHHGLSDLQKRADKNTRKGKINIDTKIDLHDLTRAQAFPVLEDKLRRAHGSGQRTVLVVTGKGPNLEGILRKNLPSWLGHPSIRPLIANYAHAHIRHGGAGAFYVFLKKK
ncbi:MAG: Smr/MutS family protein [Robiginitomaculum sp.]|nr:Smr/MutS family protein [Robiginitomaculum sp.]